MGLELYNVRTRAKEPFVPLREGKVGLYVCGLTVYDHVHIGHARTYTSFEVIRRWLEHRFGPGSVHHVMNVTDVDDKILARAQERGVSPRLHSREWDVKARAELDLLGIALPTGDDYPHVSDSVPDIVRFIEVILANGYAYATQAGNVYFDVPGYDGGAAGRLADASGRPCGYGSLSNRDYREMASGTRKEVETDKRHPADFALWKAGEAGDHPDSHWDSPWGKGRPGWHIECSLMATRALGDTFDIHGGGQDLIFPHHENEIAQSQAKTGKAPFVGTWMHTGFLNVEGEKMSKSLGNFITLADALQELADSGHGAAALRLYFIQTHYRSKIDYSKRSLAEAAQALDRLERTRRLLHECANRGNPAAVRLDGPLIDAAEHAAGRFNAAMDDDVHTPGALASLFDLQREANRALDAQTDDARLGSAAAARTLAILESCGRLLTLFDAAVAVAAATCPTALLVAGQKLGLSLAGVDEAGAMAIVLQARADARKAKEWARSDAIRDAVRLAGYLIEDTGAGARWSRV